MARKYTRRGNHEVIGYVCKTYKQQGKQFCNSHSINHSDLAEAVLSSIQEEARKILTPSDINEMDKIKTENAYKMQYHERMEQIQAEINKVENFKRKTYNNLLEEIISKNEYIDYVNGYDKKLKDLQKQKEQIFEKMEMQNEVDERYNDWVHAFKNYMNVTHLTRGMVLELIERIEVHEDGVIDIYYRFSNPFEQ